MADFPGNVPLPLFVHTWSRWSCGQEITRITGAATLAGQTWPVANTAFYYPVWLPWPYPVKRVFWINASSVVSTNMDFGIYSGDGTKIYSTGSTAASGTDATQYVTPGTDILLPPGAYYFALSDSSSTASRGGYGSVTPTVARLRLSGVLQEASALPLPATMTGVAVANAMHAICGVTRTASGF